jgi:hypothetical protein
VEEYYYSREGQRLGPVPGDQLKQLASSGQLQPNDLIWKEGMANWIQAARVKGLFPVAAPQPPEIPVGGPPAAGGDVNQAQFKPDSPRHGESAEQAKVFARQAKEAALAASTDAVKAFKVLMKNPVGGLREAYETLGPTSAMGVGIVFAAAAVLLAMVGFFLLYSVVPISLGFAFYLKLFLVAVIAIGIAIGGCAAVQAIFKGEGGIQAPVFIAGASHLPGGLAILLIGLFVKAPMVAEAVQVFGMTTVAIMLYSGCTTLLRVREVAATIVVPLIFIADQVIWHLIVVSHTGI